MRISHFTALLLACVLLFLPDCRPCRVPRLRFPSPLSRMIISPSARWS